MSATEALWYLLVLVAALYSVSNLRQGVYLGIVIDILRDVVRKVVPDQPVLITISGAAFWGVLVISAFLAQPGRIREMNRYYPRMRTAFVLLMLAIVPAAMLSVVSYTSGWKLAIIGCASYVVPLLGIVAGYCVIRTEKDVTSILRWYILINSIALLSVPMEYLNLSVPALGGIKYDWIRYSGDRTVNLMCGWYRSPDIMGLHAAHVIMFSLLLSVRSKTETQLTWLAVAMWAGFCVLLSGRRKMIGIPLVFIAVFLLLGSNLKVKRTTRLLGFSMSAVVLSGALALIFWDQEKYVEYTDFASTLFTEGVERSNEVIVGSTIGTLQQNGVLGAGLGTGTQGRYHVAAASQGPRTWQEDGVSRLFLEFGVPGVCVLLVSAFQVLVSFRRSVTTVVSGSPEQLIQLGLISVIAGDIASYAISHQQFSGDPVNGLLVTFVAGMALALTIISRKNQAASAIGQTI